MVYDNARPHKAWLTRQTLTEKGLGSVATQPIVSDLLPCDLIFFFFVHKFCPQCSAGEAFLKERETKNLSAGLASLWRQTIFSNLNKSLEKRWNKCVTLKKDYVGKHKLNICVRNQKHNLNDWIILLQICVTEYFKNDLNFRLFDFDLPPRWFRKVSSLRNLKGTRIFVYFV